jgi:rhamnose transport system ATP-binding protein
VINTKREHLVANDWLHKLDIAAPSVETPVGWLSGGSQQKVLIARALESSQRLLVLEEPTRGVDVGTKAEIYRLLARLAAAGSAILVISSDLEEVSLVASRVIVMRRRRIVTLDTPPDQAKIATIANAPEETQHE